ncbi:glycosyltransferase [Alkalibacter mobilis]|uniref:glycosyltransferase n=1 Tax=Alkalibacter mobilis TaxID=2787712 RepID=UPI00189D54A9|nr:glycosyltransferase [Alkalibacter mobilis]MBF7096121.1 glycosyltransferase [Alkalibacter mobilis]
MKVIFITYADFENLASGSSVRPYKIYKTFISLGYEVILIQGNLKSRRKSYLEYKKNGELNNADYCYIEPSTYPVHPLDYFMFYDINKKNIPIGLFYRDMYYKFPDLFPKKGFKKWMLLFRYKLDWFVFTKISDTIFFPSETMAGYFDFSSKAALPPGGEKIDLPPKELKRSVVYVGGVSERYGTGILLEAFKIINDKGAEINLNLVCRERESDFLKDYRKEKWLSIISAKGDELADVYNKSDLAVIPLKRSEYNDLAVSVKLFEYMSYGLPVVSTDCTEMARIINENNIGVVVEADPDSMADAIIKLYDDRDKLESLKKQTISALASKHLWEHRVKSIEDSLL